MIPGVRRWRTSLFHPAFLQVLDLSGNSNGAHRPGSPAVNRRTIALIVGWLKI